jgi:hypothetical protein
VHWVIALASVTFALLAISGYSWRWMIVSGLVCLPLVWYLWNTPRFHFVAPVLLFPYLLAAGALWLHKPRLAAALLTPVAGFIGWLALLLITKNGPAPGPR